MAIQEEGTKGVLRIRALRGGNTSDISAFLSDIESAYNALYWMNVRRYWVIFPEFRSENISFRLAPGELSDNSFAGASEEIVPDMRLYLSKVSINSPGFWEFIGSLNPIQQLREYLKYRHERKKDQEYRNLEERNRLALENDLLQKSVEEKEMGLLRDRIRMAREMGVDEETIRRAVWERVGPAMSRLGRHQDQNLIGGPVDTP